MTADTHRPTHVADRPEASSERVRERMRAVCRRDTAPELALRRELFHRGPRYRVDARVLEGSQRRADLVFRGSRVVAFVDGCFWHGCPTHMTWPKSNAAWWRAKIDANVHRDRDTNSRLVAAGWSVARVWEHEDTIAAADHIEQLVRSCSTSPADAHASSRRRRNVVTAAPTGGNDTREP